MSDHSKSQPGGFLFAALFLALSLILLSQLGAETKFSSKGKLFAQPAFWPAVGVIGMTFFGALHLIGQWRKRGGDGAEAVIWLRSLEYLVWFMAYVFVVPIIGYLLATLIFTIALVIRAGFRSPRMALYAAGTGLGVVLIFKTMLSVKIPGGAIYEHLPNALRTFMIVNF